MNRGFYSGQTTSPACNTDEILDSNVTTYRLRGFRRDNSFETRCTPGQPMESKRVRSALIELVRSSTSLSVLYVTATVP